MMRPPHRSPCGSVPMRICMATSPCSSAPAGPMACRWSSTAIASTCSPAMIPTGPRPTRSRGPVPRDLADLLSCRYHRTVARDNTVHLGARWVQIPRGPRGRSYAGCRVQVHERLDGHLRVVYHDTVIASQPSPDPAFVLKPREGPGQVRRRPQRGTLRHALGELGRAPLTQARAVSPSRPRMDPEDPRAPRPPDRE